MTTAVRSTSRSPGDLLRRIVTTIVLAAVAIVIIAFAVANREKVTVSFDPFTSNVPAGSVTAPLFVVLVVVLILGVVIGGVAAWLRQGKWRRAARKLEREVGELRAEVEAHKRVAGAPLHVPNVPEPGERLQLKPPGL